MIKSVHESRRAKCPGCNQELPVFPIDIGLIGYVQQCQNCGMKVDVLVKIELKTSFHITTPVKGTP